MEVNTDKMLEQQAKRLDIINSQPVEYIEDNDTICYADLQGSEYEVSHTNMIVVDVNGTNVLTLTRIIASYIYRVEFSCDTKCCDIVQWFSVTNKIFMQCAKRTIIK